MFKKSLIALLFFCMLYNVLTVSHAETTIPSYVPTQFTEEEQLWIDSHKNVVLQVGLAPYAGIDLFEYDGYLKGYLIDIVKIFEEESGLTIDIDDHKNWGEAYNGLFDQSIDILFGANPTEERLKIMAFTESVHHYPYVVLALKDSEIRTIGDLDSECVGFIEGDMVIDVFKDNYLNINYMQVDYPNQKTAIEQMLNGEINGFITSGSEVVYEYLYQFSEVQNIAELKNIFSEMTFSTRIEDQTLTNILNKIIANRADSIDEAIETARALYMHKILKLTPSERLWLQNTPVIKVGIATDYLPIDNYTNNEYTGIAGKYLTEFTNMVGIKIECVPMPFDNLYQLALDGEIDILNMAKTNDRESLFNFTAPFSYDRDAIYGLKSADTVYDIYGLEDCKIAVIDGFWHEEYLKKNLKNVEIVFTKDIKETLLIIEKGEVDYFLENPSVAEYYIEGLGYNQIVKKGTTSSDSFLYFGTQKNHEEFVSIFNKAITLMDYEKAKYEGIQSAPVLKNVQNTKLSKLLFGILVFLLIVILSLLKLFKELVAQKAKTRILKEREHLVYTDALTGLYNRLYFNSLEKKMYDYPYPQSFIMIDLNHLKSTNDTYGHQIGDILLQSFANILTTFIPHENIMRMGGDEFFIFLDGYDSADSLKLISQLKLACETSRIALDDQTSINGPIPSIGFYIRTSNLESPEMALNKADQEMYADKQQYKNKH
ncbi:MAG: hypothetical protein CVU84_11145 [Firmicutes bacterium HGW-Firmicutes-1]|jgi:diguanylate cyclase (GGDEF)-like protein|nr:MAG: hypothetical protein CVU84_11145 [Firmicutes bacterium HGW-Firmicutes-1]